MVKVPRVRQYLLRLGRRVFHVALFADGAVEVRHTNGHQHTWLSADFRFFGGKLAFVDEILAPDESAVLLSKLAARLAEDPAIDWWPELYARDTGEVMYFPPQTRAVKAFDDLQSSAESVRVVEADGRVWLEYLSEDGTTRSAAYPGETLGALRREPLLILEEAPGALRWRVFHNASVPESR